MVTVDLLELGLGIDKLMCPEGPRQNALNGPTLIFIICFKQSKVNLASFVAV